MNISLWWIIKTLHANLVSEMLNNKCRDSLGAACGWVGLSVELINQRLYMYNKEYFYSFYLFLDLYINNVHNKSCCNIVISVF